MTVVRILNIDAGVIGIYQLEFYEGDVENGSYDLEPLQNVKLGISSVDNI